MRPRARRLLRGLRHCWGIRKLALVTALLLLITLWYIGLQPALQTTKAENVARSGKGAAPFRFRATCNLPSVNWTRDQQLWVPPMCRHVFVYNGVDPAELRPVVTQYFKADGLHIRVQDPQAFGTLAQIGGSDFPQIHWPSILLIDYYQGNKYLLEISESDQRNITQPFAKFLRTVAQGQADQFLKQEYIEELPIDGGTNPQIAPLHINSKFFDRYIANRTARQNILREHELFVTFHAPWCGHCRVFLSKFEPIAQQILSVVGPGIGFYKLDVTANDMSDPRYRIAQVPTTLFFTERSDNAIELQERRRVKEGLLTFLHSHSKQITQSAYQEL